MVKTNSTITIIYLQKYLIFFKNSRYAVDKICSKDIDCPPLYYYQLRNSKKKTQKEISKTTKHNIENILTTIIKDNLIDIYPLDTWKN